MGPVLLSLPIRPDHAVAELLHAGHYTRPAPQVPGEEQSSWLGAACWGVLLALGSQTRLFCPNPTASNCRTAQGPPGGV